MTQDSIRARKIARPVYVLLILWQFTWLALLPVPRGPGSLTLTLLTCVPLLLPLAGILRLRDRGLIWGGYLVLFAAMFGLVEFWAEPAQRAAAGLQVGLCVAYLVFLALGTRKRR